MSENDKFYGGFKLIPVANTGYNSLLTMFQNPKLVIFKRLDFYGEKSAGFSALNEIIA